MTPEQADALKPGDIIYQAVFAPPTLRDEDSTYTYHLDPDGDTSTSWTFFSSEVEKVGPKTVFFMSRFRTERNPKGQVQRNYSLTREEAVEHTIADIKATIERRKADVVKAEQVLAETVLRLKLAEQSREGVAW